MFYFNFIMILFYLTFTPYHTSKRGIFQFHYDLILFQPLGYQIIASGVFQFHYDLILLYIKYSPTRIIYKISISLWSYSIMMTVYVKVMKNKNFNFIMILFYYTYARNNLFGKKAFQFHYDLILFPMLSGDI